MWNETYGRILHGIKDRRTMFSTDGDDEASYRDFQRICAALKFFEKIGVVRIRKEQKESETINEYVMWVMLEIVADPSSDDFPASQWQRIVLRRFYADRNEDIVQPISDDFADLLTQKSLDRTCSQLAEKGLLSWTPMLSGGGMGTIMAKGIEEIEETKESTMAQHISIGDVFAKNVQVGNQNTLNASTVVAHVEALIQAIERSSAPEAEKSEVKSRLRAFLAHPLISAMLGGLLPELLSKLS
jgi:hypothetical protein